MTTLENDVYYDPFDAGINVDPYPTFQRLRDEAPIYHNERYDLWALSRYEDVEHGLVDWRTFSNASRASIRSWAPTASTRPRPRCGNADAGDRHAARHPHRRPAGGP